MELLTVNQFFNNHKVYTQVVKNGREYNHYEEVYDCSIEEAKTMIQAFKDVLADLKGPCYIELRSDLRKLLPINKLRGIMLQNELALYKPFYILGKMSLEWPEFSYFTEESRHYDEIHFVYGRKIIKKTPREIA